MPDWRTELETLLSQLQVSLDVTQESKKSVEKGEKASTTSHAATDQLPQSPAIGEAETDIPWELGPLIAEEPVADGEEVSAVRSEIEATVMRVIDLTQRGLIESALRDDVISILLALTRPAPRKVLPRGTTSQQEEARQEWQLTSAAAVLRFCRIVLALTQALANEAESETEN